MKCNGCCKDKEVDNLGYCAECAVSIAAGEAELDAKEAQAKLPVSIENWSVVDDDNPYWPPELRRSHLHGNVYGHPACTDGEPVITSWIVDLGGPREVICYSRTYVVLGVVDPDYLAKVRETQPDWDPNCDYPVSMKGGSK